MHTTQILNWYTGWVLILTAFLTGAVAGLWFHREDFLGGYNSFRRRLMRLGHIAFAALGIVNVLFSIAVGANRAASLLMVVGGISMGATCYLAAWRTPFRHLFFVPVTSLLLAVIFVVIGGTP
jgi:hypothetical protein